MIEGLRKLNLIGKPVIDLADYGLNEKLSPVRAIRPPVLVGGAIMHVELKGCVAAMGSGFTSRIVKRELDVAFVDDPREVFGRLRQTSNRYKPAEKRREEKQGETWLSDDLEHHEQQ